MALNTSTIRPGLLVALKSSVVGNCRYSKTVLADDQETDGASIARWETERTIANPAEHEEAGKVRSRARKLISSVCSQSGFGLLCPEARAPELESVLAEARVLVDNFNARATITRVDLAVLTGRISPDDVEAVKAISGEVQDLLSAMERGLARFDVEAIRDAASRARSVAQMLAPGAQARVQAAVDAARNAARQLIKAGETAAKEIDTQAIAAIASARTAFLDLDVETAEIAAPEAEGRAVDFEIEMGQAPGVAQPTFKAAQVDL